MHSCKAVTTWKASVSMRRIRTNTKRLAKKRWKAITVQKRSSQFSIHQSLSSAPSRAETPDLLPPILPLCLERLAAFSPTGKGSFHSFLQLGQTSLPPCARHILPTQCECKRAGHLSAGSGHRWPCVTIPLQAMHTLIFSCGWPWSEPPESLSPSL